MTSKSTPSSTATVSPFSRLMEITAAAHGAVVNIHDVAGVTLRVPDLRLKPDQLVHHGAYCRFAKFHGRNRRCSENKRRSIVKASTAHAPFWGCCPFGVWDMALPLKHAGELVAVLYLGHFQADRPLESVEGENYTGPELPPINSAKIRTLKASGRLLVEAATLILGEWTRQGGVLGETRSRTYYQEVTERYIAAHFSERVQLSDFAAQVGAHPHHVGKMVLRACGTSFATLLRRRRLEQAKLMLRITTHDVTTIAYEAGFQDGNYFSTVFRKEFGCSPSEFRKNKSHQP